MEEKTARAIAEGRALVREIMKDADTVGDPFIDPDARAEDDGPGPWFMAGFDGECSRGCGGISEGDTIRADGDGGWECRDCVDEDEASAESAENEYRAGLR